MTQVKPSLVYNVEHRTKNFLFLAGSQPLNKNNNNSNPAPFFGALCLFQSGCPNEVINPVHGALNEPFIRRLALSIDIASPRKNDFNRFSAEEKKKKKLFSFYLSFSFFSVFSFPLWKKQRR